MSTMLSAFRSLQEEFADARPDMGMGGRGWVPPAGIRECDVVIGYHEAKGDDVKFKIKDFTCPGLRISLLYRAVEDPTLEEPKDWQSAQILLPLAVGSVPEDYKWIVERNVRRLLGFIVCLAGPGLGVDDGWEAVKNMIDASNESGNYMKVRINNRADLDKTRKPTGYVTDFLQEVLDTVSLEPNLGTPATSTAS